MEIIFYVGMIVWGFYLLVNEDIEDVKRDFGIEEQDPAIQFFLNKSVDFKSRISIIDIID